MYELFGFDKSEEWEIVYRLFIVYCVVDVDKIKYVIEDSLCVCFLDIVFSRLARKFFNSKYEFGVVVTKMGVDFFMGDIMDEDVGDDLM